MPASGVACRKPSVSTGWAISLLFIGGLRKLSSGLVGPPFLTMRLFFSVCISGHWLKAMMTI